MTPTDSFEQFEEALSAFKIAEAQVASRQKTLEVSRRRHASGQAGSDAAALRLSEENLLAAQVLVPQRQAELAKARHALALLMGQTPQQASEQVKALTRLPLATFEKMSAPEVEALALRPDLQASNARAFAALAGVDVAAKAMYPDLTLGLSVGFEAEKLSDLIDVDALAGQFLAQLLAPLDLSGALRAERRAAKARAEEAAYAHAGMWLKALKEVEDALVSEAAFEEAFEIATARLDAAKASAQIRQGRYEKGTGTLLELLEAQRREQDAQADWVRLLAARYDTRTQLALAIGGQWWPEIQDENTSTDQKETP